MEQGRVMLITGASTGIGAATARAARAAGYRLALGARSLESLQALQAELGGEQAVHVARCDVTDPDQVGELVTGAQAALGRIDVLFAVVSPARRSTPGVASWIPTCSASP